jgi:hypothetical protein
MVNFPTHILRGVAQAKIVGGWKNTGREGQPSILVSSQEGKVDQECLAGKRKLVLKLATQRQCASPKLPPRQTADRLNGSAPAPPFTAMLRKGRSKS